MADITVEFFMNGDTFVVAECWVSGRMIPATFEHDKEDGRNIDPHTISAFNADGGKMRIRKETLDTIYQKINWNFNKIYNAASDGKDSILI